MMRRALCLVAAVVLGAHAAEDKVFLWSYKTDGLVRVVPVSDGQWIFVGTTGGSVHALDDRGTRAWKTGFAKRGGRSAAIQRLSLSDGVLTVELADGGMHAIDARTGKPMQPVDHAAPSSEKPAATVSFEGCEVKVFDADSNEVTWSRTMKYAVTAAALWDEKIVICLENATVQAWGPPPMIRDRTVDEL